MFTVISKDTVDEAEALGRKFIKGEHRKNEANGQLEVFDGTTWLAYTTGAGGGAPVGAEYIVGAAHADLTAERVVTDTPTGAWDLATAGQAKVAVPDNAITNLKAADMAANTVKANATGVAADPADLAVGASAVVGRGAAGNIVAAAVETSQIANDAVTYAKMQNVSATDRLLGRDTAAAGDTEELTVGGGLEFTGAGGVQRSALSGEVTAPAGSNTTTVAATHSGSAHHAQSHGAADHSGDVLPDGSEQVLGTGDITITQKVAPTNPAAGDRKVYVDSGTGKLSVRTSGGSSVSLEEQGGGVTFAAPTAVIDIGDAAVEGVATTALRSDAQFAFTAPAAAYPVDIDSTAEADGTATTPARADHKHAIATNGVSNAKLAQMAANTVKANVGILGDPEDLAVGANTVVGRVAGDIVAAALADAQIAANTISAASQAQMAANTVKANATAALANEADLAVGTNTVVGRVGGNIVAALLATGQVAANAITDALLRQGAATSVVGRSAGTLGNVADIAATADGQALQRLAGAVSFSAITFTKTIVIASPAVDDLIMWRPPFAATLTKIYAYQNPGTGSTVNAFRGTLAAPTLFRSANYTIAAADVFEDVGALQNTAVAAGDECYARIATIAGAPTEIAIQIEMTRP